LFFKAASGQHGLNEAPRRTIGRRDLLTFRSVSTETADYWLRVHRPAMACRFEIALSGEDAGHVPAARAALDEVDRIEAALTVFRETSALVHVNRHAAEAPVEVDADLFDLLTLCRDLHAATGGAFDITSTPLSRCWGFLRRQGRLPAEAEIEAARSVVGMEHVALDAETRTVRFLRPGVELNLGAIGKGYALDRVAHLLRARGVEHALVSAAGSSVRALGGRPGDWSIDVASRQISRGPLGRLRLRDGALGTSGASVQFVEVDGKRYGHVIDPRTGWPSSGVLSATVVTDSAAAADALSTAFFVGGAELAARYCAARPGTLALLTPDDGSQRPRTFGAYPNATLAEL
jgi:FAD:protein FMN transferase